MSNIILEAKNITKDFGPTRALDNASVTIKKGTVHSLVGRNGAGKSTLVNIIAGIYPQTYGRVLLEGEEISNFDIRERMAKGIRLVTQHASVIPHLSVAENIFMGLWPKNNKNKFIDWNKMYKMAEDELNDYGLDLDPKEKVRHLNPVEQRKLNIVRALYGGAKLIILDEPTTSLSSNDRDNLFDFIVKLKETGIAFILITHYLEEVIKLSDEITVLRDGISYTGYQRGSLDEEQLGSLVAGEEVALTERICKSYDDEDVILECENLIGNCLNNVSFKLKKGEVLGFVGFPGSGARELCRSLYGLYKFQEGKVIIDNKKTNINHPVDALKRGLVYIPEDRHAEGIVQILSIRENISLPILKSRLLNKLLLSSTKEKTIAKNLFNNLKIKASSIEDKVSSLSGGNQQKVVVAKVLASEPKILILDEPTVGIDIKSREEILTIVNEMTQNGMAVIYLTNDFDELLRISDRILFFRNKEIVGEHENKDLSPEEIISIRDSVKEGV